MSLKFAESVGKMTKVVSNKAQLEKLVSLMEENSDLAKGICLKPVAAEKWAKIAECVNSLGPPIRSVDKWMKVWSDFKHKTKKKFAHNKKELNATGGGPNNLMQLNNMEQAVSELLKMSGLTDPGGKEFGVNQEDWKHLSIPS